MRAAQIGLVFIMLVSAALAKMNIGDIGMAGFGDGKGEFVPDTLAVKSDVPYIVCDVCNLVAKQAYRQTKALEKEQKPNKKVRAVDRIISLLWGE